MPYQGGPRVQDPPRPPYLVFRWRTGRPCALFARSDPSQTELAQREA